MVRLHLDLRERASYKRHMYMGFAIIIRIISPAL